MIRRHQYYFASAALFIGLCLSLAIMMPKPTKEAPTLRDVDAIKSDRIPKAPLGFPTNDNLESKPIRVIPISTAASLSQPTTPVVLTRIATALPTSAAPEEPSHAVSTPETAVSDLTPAEAVDPPRYRRTTPMFAPPTAGAKSRLITAVPGTVPASRGGDER